MTGLPPQRPGTGTGVSSYASTTSSTVPRVARVGITDPPAEARSCLTDGRVASVNGRSAPAPGSVEDARFSPDGRWLVTAGPKSARLWTAAGRPVRNLYGPKSPLVAVGLEPSSRAVVSLEPDGVVRRWACEFCGDLASLEKLAESRLRATRRTITVDERASYFR